MSYNFKYKEGDIIGWYSSIDKKYHRIKIIKNCICEKSYSYEIRNLGEFPKNIIDIDARLN